MDDTCLTYSQIVDFCCGANDFSVEVRRKLILAGKKNCEYKNFDILAPKVNLYENPSERECNTVIFCSSVVGIQRICSFEIYCITLFLQCRLVPLNGVEVISYCCRFAQLIFRTTNVLFILFVTRMILNSNNETGFQYNIANFLSVTSWWV